VNKIMSNVDFTQKELKVMLSAMLDYLDVCDPVDDEMMRNIIGKLTNAIKNEDYIIGNII